MGPFDIIDRKPPPTSWVTAGYTPAQGHRCSGCGHYRLATHYGITDDRGAIKESPLFLVEGRQEHGKVRLPDGRMVVALGLTPRNRKREAWAQAQRKPRVEAQVRHDEKPARLTIDGQGMNRRTVSLPAIVQCPCKVWNLLEKPVPI